MNRFLISAVLATLLPATAAFAQSQDRGDRKERVEQFNKRFEAADANQDGRLTKEEAQAKMPGVASHFDEIDSDKKGYVTKKDIAQSMKKMAGDRKAGAGS